MTTLRHLIRQHKRCLKLLRAIKAMQKRFEISLSYTSSPVHIDFWGMADLQHDVEIRKMAIARLEKVYEKELSKI